jgi:hypothetical protein
MVEPLQVEIYPLMLSVQMPEICVTPDKQLQPITRRLVMDTPLLDGLIKGPRQ